MVVLYLILTYHIPDMIYHIIRYLLHAKKTLQALNNEYSSFLTFMVCLWSLIFLRFYVNFFGKGKHSINNFKFIMLCLSGRCLNIIPECLFMLLGKKLVREDMQQV